MHSDDDIDHLPFGTILGFAPGKVPAYSSDYKTANPIELPDRHSFRNYINGVYMGYKWQCVEFSRRWLYLNKEIIFEDVAMAYDIFRLSEAKSAIDSSKRLPLYSFKNGSQRHPEVGSMLIWDEGGEFDVTGHVAIVTEVFPDRIRIAEQNLHHQEWQRGENYSRELTAHISDDGSYWIQCSFHNSFILGWVIQTDQSEHAETHPELDKRLLNIKMAEVSDQSIKKKSWLNLANPDEEAYVKVNGYHLSSNEADEKKYFYISRAAENELKRATNELHALFLHATDRVLQDDKLLAKFNLPESIWPRIHQSWDNRRNQMITGRFDFCMTEQGIKLYEYNADSASCHMECGKVQGMWAEHFKCDDGEDSGEDLFSCLVDAWAENEGSDTIHILIDQDGEEIYHALFMKSAIEEALGNKCKMIKGLDSIRWDNHVIVDQDGEPIKRVWKTWAWETALDELRENMDEPALINHIADVTHKPRLKDVLFQPGTIVYEPLWTLIPSNKAILPVLWDLFPDHPYLLRSEFELSDQLKKDGYVSKPIAGRGGLNICVYDNQTMLQETGGRFHEQDYIYQALCKLPNIGGYSSQICTFSAGGTYAGSCMRVDKSVIITGKSDVMPLRVIDDKSFLSRL